MPTNYIFQGSVSEKAAKVPGMQVKQEIADAIERFTVKDKGILSSTVSLVASLHDSSEYSFKRAARGFKVNAILEEAMAFKTLYKAVGKLQLNKENFEIAKEHYEKAVKLAATDLAKASQEERLAAEAARQAIVELLRKNDA